MMHDFDNEEQFLWWITLFNWVVLIVGNILAIVNWPLIHVSWQASLHLCYLTAVTMENIMLIEKVGISIHYLLSKQ